MALRTYQVVSPSGFVLTESGQSLFYASGSSFSAQDTNSGVQRGIENGFLADVTGVGPSADVPIGAIPVGPAGGDLTGFYPNPTIAQKGASSSQVLTWNGSAWMPAASGGGPPTGAAGGDLAGTYPNPTIAQKGATLNQVLAWNGSAWVPVSLATPALSAVLAVGNTTGANNIVVTSGQKVVSAAASALTLDGTTVLNLQIAAATVWQVNASGHIVPQTDNVLDIGITATNRIRTLYAGTSVVVGSSVTIGTAAVTGSGALAVTATSAGLVLAATGANTVAVHTNGSARLTLADAAATLAEAVDIVVGTTTGTKLGTSATQKLGFWNAAPVVQSAVAGLVNNITASGTTDQIDDYTFSTYAADGQTIRDDLSQLARKLDEVVDALRLYGMLG